MDNIETTELLDKSLELINDEQFEDAYELLKKASKKDPDNIEILKNLGLTLINLQDFIEAKKIFISVTKKDPDNANAWYYLGSIQEKLDDFNEAIISHKKVIELRPK